MAYHLFHYALLTFLVVPTRSAPVQLTIPNITSLPCYDDAHIAWELIVYLGVNYIAHAIAVPVAVEVGRYTERVTRQDRGHWTAVISLFLPFGALARTVILIAEQIKCRGDDIRAALHHGALLVAVRNKDWEPSAEGDIIFAKLPDNCETLSQGSDKSLTDACIEVVAEEHAFWRIPKEVLPNRNLHGHMDPPSGYDLAVPDDKAFTEYIIEAYLRSTKHAKIHHPPGVTKMLVSVFQIIMASFTLYFSRGAGGQTERWGYAAYPLSVFPYALMSVMNLLCAGYVGEYASGHVLRTPILEEAEKRMARTPDDVAWVLDGTIGTVRRLNPLVGSLGSGGYTSVKMKVNLKTDGDRVSKRLIVEGRDGERTYNLVSADEADRADKAILRFSVSALCHDGPPSKDDLTEYRKITWQEVATCVLLILSALILPYALIYALTGFRARQSTVAQRAWMMAWLAGDQFSSCGTFVFWLVWKRWHDIIPTKAQYLCVLILIVPAVGGFVMVGEMFLQDYGFTLNTCSL